MNAPDELTPTGFLTLLAGLIWEYGDPVVDDNEIEFHVMSISHEDISDYGKMMLEVYHDNDEEISYYRVNKVR